MKKAQKHSRSVSSPVDYSALAECVSRFSSRRIVLFGDCVADEFQFGEISRVSREAPVLILRHREMHRVPGGGANAANNLADLGAKVSLVSAVGADSAGDALLDYLRAKRVDLSGVVRVKNWATPIKTRFLAGWPHTKHQQVLRVDREPETRLPEEARNKLRKKLLELTRSADGVAISDYGFGTADPELVSDALRKRKNLRISTIDARQNLERYAGSGLTSATPNEPELEALHHTAIGQDLDALERCGRETLTRMKLDALLVTRGRDGMALFEPGKATVHIPVHGTDQAVDVTGAGDTVLAVFTLALACGGGALEAAHLANIAGGLVVMKRGTATVRRQELLAAIRADLTGS